MEKVYKPHTRTSRTRCKKHFIEKFDREPAIYDIATVGYCFDCLKSNSPREE